ncbi:hypothetical protein ACJX0J_008661, partial [Zea mays]
TVYRDSDLFLMGMKENNKVSEFADTIPNGFPAPILIEGQEENYMLARHHATIGMPHVVDKSGHGTHVAFIMVTIAHMAVLPHGAWNLHYQYLEVQPFLNRY